MPRIYLSPSTQDWNLYINGGTEEYYMNLVADAMEPYLLASGISFTRNTPDMTAATSIAASNNGDYDAHVSLHSNAAPEALSGELQGPDIYYYPTSAKGKRLAELIALNLKAIYPNPDLVDIRATTTIGEVRRTKAPAVLIEFAYHDNEERRKLDQGQHRAHGTQRGAGAYRVFWPSVRRTPSHPQRHRAGKSQQLFIHP